MTRSASPLSEDLLSADVQRYDSFGEHRLGSPGAEAALDWMAADLTNAGLAVSQQRFVVGRQYGFERGRLTVAGFRIPVVPQWWPPLERSFVQQAGRVGTGSGDFHVLELPYDQGAYLSGTQKEAIGRACAHAAALFLCIRHPSGEIFTYNVAQQDAAWPVPVVLVAPVYLERLQPGYEAVLTVEGTWQHNVPARNIIARTPRRSDRTVVVSTPVTSWFTSTGERAPGIACFLALARQAMARWPRHDLVFVATSGHEVGHGGMEQFLAREAPPAAETALWLHLGASLACHPCERHGERWRAVPGSGAMPRFALASDVTADLVSRHLGPGAGSVLTGASAAIGELREVQRAGYPRFAGMIGQNPLFHTPVDRAFVTSGAILAPVQAAFEAMMDEIDSTAG
jgi:hypothetical protein